MSAQIIELNGVPAFAVVPVAEWNALLTRLEEVQDIADAKAARDSETFPAEFADRLLSGESPLRVWRSYRGQTLQTLAGACGVTRQMLSMIEHGKAKPSIDLLGKLADALGCDMGDLHG
ncbi:MAG: helix-turn-helix transcriptional regulator [Sulfuricellaceae bacterium]|nr:helix-turn-helix transcriptional regulator [Sulfuricellaceae bacterium]